MSVDLNVVFNIVVPVLLAVNAYFIKDLLNSINQVKLELARLLSQHDNSKEKIADHSEDIKDLYKQINGMRDRLHSIEGYEKAVIKMIDEKQ